MPAHAPLRTFAAVMGETGHPQLRSLPQGSYWVSVVQTRPADTPSRFACYGCSLSSWKKQVTARPVDSAHGLVPCHSEQLGSNRQIPAPR